MPQGTDLRNSLPYWVPLFIIVTGFVHSAINAVWLKIGFHQNLSWFDFVNELVSKPNEFFWLVMIVYAFDLFAIILGFLMLYGRSVSKRKKIAD